jgi:D-alanine-D-alanine ligase
MDRMRVAVLVGGPARGHEASLGSGAHVVASLDPRRYETRLVLVTRDGRWRVAGRAWPDARGAPVPPDALAGASLAWREHSSPLAAIESLRERGVDVVLPVLGGRVGEEGLVQACLATAGLAFAGSGPRARAVASDRVRTREVLAFHGVRTAPFAVVDAHDLERGRPQAAADVLERLGAPVVVRDARGPSEGGSRVVRTARDAVLAFEALAPPAERLLVEAHLRGRSLSACVLDDRERGGPVAFPVVDRPPPEAAARGGGAPAVAVPDGDALPALADGEARALALRVHAVLGLRGLSRTDLLLEEDGRLAVTAVRASPGLSETSAYPRAAAAGGMGFPALLDRILRTAARA